MMDIFTEEKDLSSPSIYVCYKYNFSSLQEMVDIVV